MEIKEYLENLINTIFKVLPMREQNADIDCLMQHLESVSMDARGAQAYYKELRNNRDFQTVINILIFLGTSSVDEKGWKREILKATNLLSRVINQIGGDADGR